MLDQAIALLKTLGVYDSIVVIAVAVTAMFLYRYFTKL